MPWKCSTTAKACLPEPMPTPKLYYLHCHTCLYFAYAHFQIFNKCIPSLLPYLCLYLNLTYSMFPGS